MMLYKDGEYAPEIGDLVDVFSEEFEPEEAEVVKIGKRGKIRVRWVNPHIKPQEQWVVADSCEMVRRAG